jgi:hypothetical protein
LAPRWTGRFEIVERLEPETFNIRCPRGKLVKYHISQLKRANTAIHQQAENDEIPAANDSPDDPDLPQRKRGRPRKHIPTPWANKAPDKTTRTEKGENLDQDETPSPSAVPRRRRGRPRKDDAEYQNHQEHMWAAPKEELALPSAPDEPHAPKKKQSAWTVRPKTLRAKGYKKRQHETREEFLGIPALGNDDSRPRATKEKTSPNLHDKKTVFPRKQ